MTTSSKTSLIYFGTAIMAICLAFASEAAVIMAANARDARPSSLAIYLLNILPAALTGVACFGITTLALMRFLPVALTLTFLRRLCVPLVLAVILVVTYIEHWATAGSDFGLYQQVILWPMVSVLAGLAGEAALAKPLRAYISVGAA